MRVAEFSVQKGISAYVTGESSPKRSRKFQKKQKRCTKVRKAAKKGRHNCLSCKKVNRIFQGTEKSQENILCKADKKMAQFSVRRVWRSNALSSAHRHGRASGIVDGNFPCCPQLKSDRKGLAW